MTSGPLGPFQPGTGRLPPLLAGREPEQSLFRMHLESLDQGIAPPSAVVLYGPRGNGKTSLLRWLEIEAARFPGLDVLDLRPAGIHTWQELAEQLVPQVWWQRLAPHELSLAGITWQPGNTDLPRLANLLTARVRKRPLALLLDEAHTLETEVGRTLLNASEQVGSKLPFLLVLAGTPNLRDRLGQLGASFWNRAQKIPIGRLSDAAVAEAIRQPLAEEDIGIEDEALREVVRRSDGYPFFVQLWGAVLWERVARAPAADTGRRITQRTVAESADTFEGEKEQYYLDRYSEFERLMLLPVARAVADAFRDRDSLSAPELTAAIGEAMGDEGAAAVVAAGEELRRLGYVWRSRGIPDWEPGIPSLMNYMRKFAPARQ